MSRPDAAVTSLGQAAVGGRGDVSRPAGLDDLYATIAGDGRRVDVLFANAGVGRPGPAPRSPRSTSTTSSA
jgi:NAD(P)-dependent dehydrogenase (short-subunit alcohol dehydrogenase family)